MCLNLLKTSLNWALQSLKLRSNYVSQHKLTEAADSEVLSTSSLILPSRSNTSTVQAQFSVQYRIIKRSTVRQI